MLLGMDATEDGIKQLRSQLGLDKPIHARYCIFLVEAFKGNFGRSFGTQRPVIEEIRYAFQATLELAVASLLIAVSIGIPIGITSAVHQYSLADKIVRITALIAASLPIFWFGLILILVFSVILKLLPSFGRGGWQHLILPAEHIPSIFIGSEPVPHAGSFSPFCQILLVWI